MDKTVFCEITRFKFVVRIMAERRRASFLALMLLLDFCLGHPTLPPPSGRAHAQGINDVTEINVDDVTDNNALSVLDEFFKENGIDFKGTNRTFCNNPGENEFYRRMKDTPVAGEIYTLLTGIFLELEGCQEESNFRLGQLQLSSEIHPDLIQVVLDMVEALENEDSLTPEFEAMTPEVLEDILLEIEKTGSPEDGDNLEEGVFLERSEDGTDSEHDTEIRNNNNNSNNSNSSNNNTRNNSWSNEVQRNLDRIIMDVHLMESLIPESKELGALECHWREITGREITSCPITPQNKEHWNKANSKDRYGRILEAKLACERWGSECVGFLMSHNRTMYQLRKECGSFDTSDTTTVDTVTQQPQGVHITDQPVENTTTMMELWLKECPSDGSNRGAGIVVQTSLRRSSHVVRRDATGSEAYVTAHEHIDYSGAAKRFTGAVDAITDPWSDMISSFSFPSPDWSVVIFEEPNFEGNRPHLSEMQVL